MREIDNEEELDQWLSTSGQPVAAAVQALDLSNYHQRLLELKFNGSLFLGCAIEPAIAGHIVSQGGLVIPNHSDFEFSTHRAQLYQPQELFAGFDLDDPDGYQKTHDYQIYAQYKAQGKASPDSIQVSLMRRLHDHSITDALLEKIENRKVVAVMGGHSMERQDPFYAKVARVSRLLTQQGFLMISGGGPGAMEATHIGAYFATRTESELMDAIKQIKVRPENAKPGKEYSDKDWLHRAWRILQEYPLTEGEKSQSMSIGIPTWLYGHEPPTPFATHIAKYFANSVREDGLLAIAKHGVIFAPGSAGTTQEIFQDAAQNHYGTTGFISPMILFGKEHWTNTRPIWQILEKVASGKRYGELIALTDDENEIVRLILAYQADDYVTS